jgi:LmbE family N-acetylglucosaminyl deacetylase
MEFTYYDLRRGIKSKNMDLIFPGWSGRDEHVLVLSPHDDDGVIGAGYLMLAALAQGAKVSLAIFCNGCFGYSQVEDKETICATRAQETLDAYHILGISQTDILRFDYPDYGTWPALGWNLPSGELGTTSQFLPTLRSMKPTRLLLPNGYREHQDHEAVYRVGAYDGPQAGDAILAELGQMVPIRSFLQYSVWSDFSPEDALVYGAPANLRANLAVQVSQDVEDKIVASVKAFGSQAQIIEHMVVTRAQNRVRAGKGLELYLGLDPRPKLNYEPYHMRIAEISVQLH